MEPEAPQDPIPKPKPGKGRGAKFVVVLVTLATLVGGVAAGFQIFDYFKAEPSQEKPEDPLAWKTIELGKGFSASLPPNWQVVDRDSMEAMTRGLRGRPSFLRVRTLHFTLSRKRIRARICPPRLRCWARPPWLKGSLLKTSLNR
jgi:hypothetical protein